MTFCLGKMCVEMKIPSEKGKDTLQIQHRIQLNLDKQFFYAFIIQFKLQTIQRMKSPLLILSSPKICKILLRMVIFGKICGSFPTLFFVHCFTPFFAHMQNFLWVPDHSNFFNQAKFKQTCIGLDFFTRCSCFAIIIQL